MDEKVSAAEKKRMTREGARIVLKYIKDRKRELAVLSVFAIISALANGTVPYVAGRLFDAINALALGQTVPQAPFALLAFWLSVQIVANTIDWRSDLRKERFGTYMRLDYLGRAFKKLLRLPVQFHKDHKPGEVSSRIMNASQGLVNISERVIIQITPQLLSVAVGFGIIFWLHPGLAFVLFGGVCIYSVVLFSRVPKLIALEEVAQQSRNEYLGYTNDLLLNIFSIKHSAAEAYEEGRIDRVVKESAYLWNDMERVYVHTYFYARLISLLTQLLIFAYSIVLVGEQVITVGTLVAFNGYAAMVFSPFSQLANWMRWIQEGLVSLVKSEKALTAPAEPYHGKTRKKLERLIGKVTFAGVSFSYGKNEKDVLADVSFEVQPGEVIALVGQSGVGKSTLVDLISGYYFGSSGSIEIDGIDITKLDLEALRKHIAVVPQEISLFNATLRENIVYGAFDATDAKIEKVVHEAELNEFIASLPQGYDTIVGNRGIKLSVGQKQRVAIARAMLRNPSILILDEPTSALDSHTERAITEALERLMKGRTTFIVAHRLSTVRKANRILVLEQGRIAEHGSHDELMAIKNGVYRRLYEMHIGLQ